MRDSSSENNDRGNMERLGESAGAMAGRAADFGMEVSGAIFRSAAEMLGGWWSTDEGRQAAGSWGDQAERNCRSHFQANAAGSAGEASGSMTAGGTTGGATQATHAAPKSQHAAMQSAGEVATDSGGVSASGRASVGGASMEGSVSMDSGSDGFERARPGYQLGYVARQNPAYRGRSFNDIEPELQRVWETRASTQGGSTHSSSSWPEVRGFVDFAYQQGGDRDR